MREEQCIWSQANSSVNYGVPCRLPDDVLGWAGLTSILALGRHFNTGQTQGEGERGREKYLAPHQQ